MILEPIEPTIKLRKIFSPEESLPDEYLVEFDVGSHIPIAVKTAPKPPPGPPNRSFRPTFFGGAVETDESIQRRRDYDNYMRGWTDAMGHEPKELAPSTVEYIK